LTWPAILVGWLLGSIICLSIGYAALILGFSIEGSELAAILGWGILRGIMRRSSIVENNINQTIASAVNGASAGMMFSVPALFILASNNPERYGEVTEFSKVLMVLACITGGILGLGFIIPLRKQMIDFERLAYPGGIAVATILKSPGAGLRKAVLLLGGAIVSGGVFTALLFTLGDDPKAHVGDWLGLPSYLNVTFFLSMMTIGVGFLSGRGGMVFGYGGFICYFVLAPLLSHNGHQSVVDLYEPGIRRAIVEDDNAKHVVETAGVIREFDPAAADRLLAATHAAEIVEARRRANLGQSEQGPTVDAIIAEQHLLDADQAAAILAAADALEQQADAVKRTDPDNATSLKHRSETLLKDTRVEDVRSAIAAIDAQEPAIASAIRDAASARVVIDTLASTTLPVEKQKAILRATRAEENIADIPDTLRFELFRPTGIGMLIGAAIGGIVAAFPLIVSAVKSMQQAAKEKGTAATSDEMPIKLLYAAIICGALALITISEFSASEMQLWRAATMALLGTLWIWIAGVIVSECLGRTNWSPLSGMTLIAVTILILVASGLGDTATIVSSVIVGAAICVAIAQAGDMMLDLKSGYLVGARPRMQQYGQYIGAWLGPILTIFLIFGLHSAYGLGSDKLPAPQGTALATVIDSIVGGDVPSWRYTAGAGLGALLAFSGLGGVGVQIGLGFYMPFDIVLTYTIGCLTRIAVDHLKGRHFVENVGIPIAAGLIVGEALVGVVNAMSVAIYKIVVEG
jgi:uncharacterized oligopeptide transporter (OPT) family protein